MKRIRTGGVVYRVTVASSVVTLDDGTPVDPETAERILTAVQAANRKRAALRRQERHDILTSCGLTRCRVNGRTFYE